MKLLIALYHRFKPWIAPPWFSQQLREDFVQIDVVQLPDYERITELVKRYHRKGHVTTAWWEEEMWGSKHRGR